MKQTLTRVEYSKAFPTREEAEKALPEFEKYWKGKSIHSSKPSIVTLDDNSNEYRISLVVTTKTEKDV